MQNTAPPAPLSPDLDRPTLTGSEKTLTSGIFRPRPLYTFYYILLGATSSLNNDAVMDGPENIIVNTTTSGPVSNNVNGSSLSTMETDSTSNQLIFM